MKNKYMHFPFIMGILAFGCFLLVALSFAAGTVQPPWGPIFILIVPSLVFCVIGVLAWKGLLNSKKTTVLTIILTVVLLVLSYFYVIILAFLSAEATTETKYYERAYRHIAHEEYVKDVFPAVIPEDAQDATFYYTPQFLQGGETFRLSYKTTEEKITEWAAFLGDRAKWVGSDNEWLRMNHWNSYGPDSVRYHLYWDGGFNHGEWCYVLIFPSECKIEFFYEHW